jgi:hypothetical protein
MYCRLPTSGEYGHEPFPGLYNHLMISCTVLLFCKLKGVQELEVFASDFEFCTIYIKIFGKIFFDWSMMGGATIVPRSLKTKRNRNFSRWARIFFIF